MRAEDREQACQLQLVCDWQVGVSGGVGIVDGQFTRQTEPGVKTGGTGGVVGLPGGGLGPGPVSCRFDCAPSGGGGGGTGGTAGTSRVAGTSRFAGMKGRLGTDRT